MRITSWFRSVVPAVCTSRGSRLLGCRVTRPAPSPADHQPFSAASRPPIAVTARSAPTGAALKRATAVRPSVPFPLRVPLCPLFLSFVSLSATLAPATVCAQTTDVIGVRAQGMAGAFTAVADDATAGWWNPAGLAGGALFNGLVEDGRPQKSQPESGPGFAAAYPAFGLTHYPLPPRQKPVATPN